MRRNQLGNNQQNQFAGMGLETASVRVTNENKNQKKNRSNLEGRTTIEKQVDTNDTQWKYSENG